MNEEKKCLIEYLKGKAGGKELMTPAQLAQEIGVSAKRQSELRQEGKFPIPHTNFGRLVFYSIYAIADFLLYGKTKEVSEPIKVAKTEEQPKTKRIAIQKIRNRPIDLSQQLLLGFMVEKLKEQRKQLDTMIGSFEQLAKAKGLHDELQDSLAIKSKKIDRPVKSFKA